jgi:hypothetical protein
MPMGGSPFGLAYFADVPAIAAMFAIPGGAWIC